MAEVQEHPLATLRTSAPRPAPLASFRHTAGLVLIMLALCLLGAYQQSKAGSGQDLVAQHRGIVPLYLSLIISEWALVGYVMGGVRRRGVTLREVIGGRWRNALDVLRDVAIAAVFTPLWFGVAWLTHWFLGPDHAKTVAILLPRGFIEIGLWILVSASAGFCEELVFRGYLQKQLHVLTGSAVLAVLGQALVFGVGHGYQGTKQVIVIVVLGLTYGLLAHFCRSTRPGAFAHAWSDIYGGIFAR